MLEIASFDDLDAIMKLVDDAKVYMHSTKNYQWDENYPLRDTFSRDIKNKDLYKLSINGKLIGFICINMVQPIEYSKVEWLTPENSLVIHRMVVDRNEAEKGLAQQMMRFAEDMAIQKHVFSIRSDTNSMNKAMQHIFEKFEYRFTGHIVLRQKPDLFCCYEKHLKQKLY